MMPGMKSRRITAPEPVVGVVYRAANVTGEVYESSDITAIIRRTLVAMQPGDEWTFTREDEDDEQDDNESPVARDDSKSPTKVMSVLEAATQAIGQAMTYGTGIIVRGEDGFFDTLDPSKYTIKEMIG
jgi:hypothetical protein